MHVGSVYICAAMCQYCCVIMKRLVDLAAMMVVSREQMTTDRSLVIQTG